MAINTAVDTSAVARVLGIKAEFKDLRAGNVVYLPMRIAVLAQGSSDSVYSTDKRRVTSAVEAGNLYGFGSPAHLAVSQLLPNNGDGVGTIPVTVYPLAEGTSAVAATGDITPAGTQTEAAAYRVVVNGIQSSEFVISADDAVATITAAMTQAINANLAMPVKATDSSTKVDLESKWKGASANAIKISIEGSTTAGTTFAITQPTGGLVNPDLQAALDQFGSVWETLVLNTLNIDDTTALNALRTTGEGRRGALVKSPFIAFTGTTEADVTAATTLPDSRKTDRINSQLVCPGSPELPFVAAARQLSRIAPVANNNPPEDYGSQSVTEIEPGADGVQWTHIQKDLAVKAGSSTVDVKDGVVTLSDIVTMYHPTGETTPGYRYVVDFIKEANFLFNLDLIFNRPEWDGAPLIPDDQPTVNRSAKKPKLAVAEVHALIDKMALDAIISDPEFAKANTVAEIDPQNPKRWNLNTTFKLSGNSNIASIEAGFGFHYGTSEVVA